MGYRNLRHCLDDLDRTGQLVRIDDEIDPHLEAAEIQRRVYQAGGPAVYYARVKGCSFPMVSNLFGTIERTRFLFRDALESVRHLIELKIDPSAFWKNPWRYRDVPRVLAAMLPRKASRGPVLAHQTTIDQLPQLVSWPNDGGAFITLPEVYTEDPTRPGLMQSNLGMYRVQLSGGQYQPNREIGLHYQIHRSIGVHHAAAIRRGEPLKVNIFVGGTPAMILSAVMPLPEGLSELTFAGALSRRGIRMVRQPGGGLPVYGEADFCITGTIDSDRLLPEGPFGDHLGYYSLAHDFPVLKVDRVYHRTDAVWPFTVVGRPPQEDTSFGQIIHELTGPAIPTVLPGVQAVHAVDAAGVHPLLLAVGSERYVPYASQRRPQELLTIANAILGQGQLSLAKFLFLVAHEDDPQLDIHDIPAFFAHLLRRADWQTDLHFQTQTTIDTLDYSGTGLNAGSKLVIAAAGPPRRDLPTEIPSGFHLPDGFGPVRLCLPGIAAVGAPPFTSYGEGTESHVARFCRELERSGGHARTGVFAGVSMRQSDVHSHAHPPAAGRESMAPGAHALSAFPLLVLVDDADFAAGSLNNFLWTAFTRANPAADLHGLGAFTHQKHWGCRGPLVLDARIKPHHAPPLVEDPAVTKRVDRLAAPGGPLHGIL